MLGIPARLWLLQDLPQCDAGQKVRFLGCIRSYDSSTATLTLGVVTSRTAAVKVDVSVPAPSLKMGSLSDGEWVNVIGVVRSRAETPEVDAIAVLNAGNMDIYEYEEAVRERLKLGI